MRFVLMLNVGASLTESTVTRKLLVAFTLPPSVTTIEIKLVPERFVTEVRLKVRLAVVPERTRFPFGINVVFVEVAVTVRLDKAVSTSPIAKVMFVLPASSRMVRLVATLEKVGG